MASPNFDVEPSASVKSKLTLWGNKYKGKHLYINTGIEEMSVSTINLLCILSTIQKKKKLILTIAKNPTARDTEERGRDETVT